MLAIVLAVISDIVIVAIVASIAPTIMAMGSMLASMRNWKKLGHIHTEVNSRLTQLLEETRKSSIAEGRQVQRDEQMRESSKSNPATG